MCIQHLLLNIILHVIICQCNVIKQKNMLMMKQCYTSLSWTWWGLVLCLCIARRIAMLVLMCCQSILNIFSLIYGFLLILRNDCFFCVYWCSLVSDINHSLTSMSKLKIICFRETWNLFCTLKNFFVSFLFFLTILLYFK